MNVSALHTLTEDLASFLSEVTQGDLGLPTPSALGDVGDLYLHLVGQNLEVTAAVTGEEVARDGWPADRAALDAHGPTGLEVGYRRSARLVEAALAPAPGGRHLPGGQELGDDDELATLYERQITTTLIHTWDIAQALGMPYRPAPDTAVLVLSAVVAQALRGTSPGAPAGAVDDASLLGCILVLAGRELRVPVPAERVRGRATGSAPEPAGPLR